MNQIDNAELVHTTDEDEYISFDSARDHEETVNNNFELDLFEDDELKLTEKSPSVVSEPQSRDPNSLPD